MSAIAAIQRAPKMVGSDPHEARILLPLAKRIRFSANHLIFSQGDATDYFFLLEQGCVRVFYTSCKGKEITFFNCQPNNLFGLAEAVTLRPRSASAQTTESSVAWAIDCRGLDAIAAGAPRFMLRIAEAMSHRLHSVAVLMESVMAVPLRARVAAYLVACEKASPSERTSEKGLTHEMMANLLGCARQTLTKVLNEFARAGFINIERKRVVVLDLEGLSKHADMAAYDL